jgi:3-oxoadipate enol-lactonase
MRDDTLAFLDALDLGSAGLVGHSMGGVVAYLVAAHAPDRITCLVLEDPGTPDPADPPREIPSGPEEGDTCDWRMVAELFRWRNDPDPAWWQLFPAITCPALVVAGGPASHLPQDRVALIADRVRDGRLVTVDVGHSVHRDSPTEFLAAVQGFLQDRPQERPQG